VRFYNNPGEMCVLHAAWDINFSDDGYGKGTDYIEDTPAVGSSANDQFSSLRVTRYSTETDPWMQLYKDCAYGGYQWFVTSSVLNSYGEILKSQLESGHMGNDAVSRIRTGKLAAAQIFEHDLFAGSSKIIPSNSFIDCLTSLDNENWNDRISSIKFMRLSTSAPFKASGSWILRSSGNYNQDLSWILAFGVSTTDSRATTNTFGTELTTSVEAGLSFGSVTVSATISHSIAQETSSSTTRSTSITCTLTCARNSCSSGQQYLYTWHMDFTRPWDTVSNTQLDSCNTICICGPSAPNCPLKGCADDQCQRCI